MFDEESPREMWLEDYRAQIEKEAIDERVKALEDLR